MRERISNIKGSPQLIFPLKIFNEPVYGSYILLRVLHMNIIMVYNAVAYIFFLDSIFLLKI